MKRSSFLPPLLLTSCHKQLTMLVKAIELALNNMKKETDKHKHQVLFQQCLNRLSMIRENFISEESLLEVPGFSEYVIRQIKNRIDIPPEHANLGKKRKPEKHDQSSTAKKQPSHNFIDDEEYGSSGAKQALIPNPGEGYKPEPGSGAYAVLKALNDESPASLTKEELKLAASHYCRYSMKETGPTSAWKEITLLLRKRLVLKTGKGAQESYIITAKGMEVAGAMDGQNGEKEDLLREIRAIGDILPHIEKALVTRFRSNVCDRKIDHFETLPL